jgi:hypothetical protein
MKYKKGQSGNLKGKPKGAKTKLSEAFYEDCLVLYSEMGLDGLRAFVNKCPRNKEIFFSWLSRWAEKQIKQATEISGPNGSPVHVKLEKVITTIDPNGSGSSGE